MVDVTAPSAVVPPGTTTTASPASSRLSSRQYLEELRARRLGKAMEPNTPVSPAVEMQPEPVQPSQVVQREAPNVAPISNVLPAQEFRPEPIVQPAYTEQPVIPQAPQTPQPNYTQPVAPQSQPQPQPQPTSDIFPGQARPMPEEIVYEWSAASRPFKKRNKQFYTTIGLITILISLILFFAGQFLPIAVVISVAFLAYVLSSVAPETINNKITTYGIRTDENLYYWDELGRFWFDQRYGLPLVHIEVGRFPGRLTLLLNENQQTEVESLLSEVLLQQKPQETFVDKSAKWLQEKVPLDVS